MKPKFSMDTLNDNVDNAKSCRWKRLILQFAAKTNFPWEYFLAADRGVVYIIKGHKLSSVCFSFKVVHSEDHFSEEGLFGNRFSKSSFKFTGKWKVRVPSHASVSKYHANKNYANLWFILLQVTKGFRFQKNKNVRFISGNFSSERFSWKVKTIRGGLYILINKHLQYQCLEFTILKRTWPIFAKTITSNSWHYSCPPWRYFKRGLFIYFVVDTWNALPVMSDNDKSAGLWKVKVRSCFGMCLLMVTTYSNNEAGDQRAKKVVSDSPGLVDFAIGLVNSVLNLPDGQVKIFRRSKITEVL